IPPMEALANESPNKTFVEHEIKILKGKQVPHKKDVYSAIRKIIRLCRAENSPSKSQLIDWLKARFEIEKEVYSSHLHSESKWSASNLEKIDPTYSDEAHVEDGRVVLRDN